jgi:hypothetical protein
MVVRVLLVLFGILAFLLVCSAKAKVEVEIEGIEGLKGLGDQKELEEMVQELQNLQKELEAIQGDLLSGDGDLGDVTKILQDVNKENDHLKDANNLNKFNNEFMEKLDGMFGDDDEAFSEAFQKILEEEGIDMGEFLKSMGVEVENDGYDGYDDGYDGYDDGYDGYDDAQCEEEPLDYSNYNDFEQEF